MIKLVCNKCKKEYQVQNYRKLTSKTCSKVCHNSIAGKIGGSAGKGVTRNNGVKRPYLSARNKVVVYKGKDSGMWKGDKIGYLSMHQWIRYNYGKPTKCERCNSTKNVQWANKSHNYERENRNDWMQLCCSCHRKYDLTEAKHLIGRFKNHKINPRYQKAKGIAPVSGLVFNLTRAELNK